ncbi:MAG TPA: hypothetical protein VMV69_01815 [Pirellulales bacterium]|nr:hypothetical protein [Pirellulales bacterium]
MTIDKPKKMLLIIVTSIVVLLGVIYFRNGGQDAGDDEAVGGRDNGANEHKNGHDADWRSLRDQAAQLQADEEWCDAEKKWRDLRDRLPSGSELREEAKRNAQLCKDHCQPAKDPVDQVKILERPGDERPQEVPKDKLTAAYRKGRTVRSTAYLFIDGKGTNDDWVFRDNVNFHYQYRVLVETEVKENGGTTVVFEQRFLNVDELRAVSDQKLEFHWPESPILDMVWERADDELSQVPAYRVVKGLAKLFNTLDPNAKKTLTRLRKFIPGLPDGKHLEVVERIRELAGQRLQSEYVSGLGVTSIKVLDGRKIDPDVLDHVARGSTVLMDYFVHKALDEGHDPIVLHSKDVGDMFHLGEEGRVEGEVRLRRAGRDDAESIQKLEIEDGEFDIEIDEAGAKQSVRVTPKKGTMRYSREDMLIRHIDATWKADMLWATRDHLLFGARVSRDIEVRTYYEAKLISKGGVGE